nr:MAG TPA: hypothetical protein [Caudoviricetes sp.]
MFINTCSLSLTITHLLSEGRCNMSYGYFQIIWVLMLQNLRLF